MTTSKAYKDLKKEMTQKEFKLNLARRIQMAKEGKLSAQGVHNVQADVEKALFEGIINGEKELKQLYESSYSTKQEIKSLLKDLASGKIPKNQQNQIMEKINQLAENKGLVQETQRIISKHFDSWRQASEDEAEAERIIQEEKLKKRPKIKLSSHNATTQQNRVRVRPGTRRIIRRIRYG